MHGSSKRRSLWPAVVGATLAAMVTAAGVADPEPEPTRSASPGITVRIGDREVTCTPRPRLRDGHVLVPSSFFTDCLGGSASYDDATRTWSLTLSEHSLLIRTWQRHFVLDGDRGEARWAPELLGDTLFIPLWTLSHSFGLNASFAETPDGGVITCKQLSGSLRHIRCGWYPDKTRVVLDLDVLVGYSWEQEDDGSVLVRLPPVPPGKPLKRRLVSINSPWVQEVQQRSLPDRSVQVRIVTTGEVVPKVFTLGNPARIVVDIERPAPEPSEAPQQPVAPEQVVPTTPDGGMWAQERQFATANGTVRLNVLYVDLRAPGVHVQPALAAHTVAHKARPSAIARRDGAYAAVNGGFFAPRGEPLGMLVINGEWISHPILGRAALGIMQEKAVLIDNVHFDGSVGFPGIGTLRLTGINARHREGAELILYNRRWADYVQGTRGATRVAITEIGVISRVATDGTEVFIPPGGWVLSGTSANATRLAKAQPGTCVSLSLATRPQWDGLLHALGGGPRLVKDGQPYVTAVQERFKGDVRTGRAPRTAAAVDADGRLMLVTVDGRDAGGSGGMTLGELAIALIKLGAKDAMNLDGGSSSTFVIGSRVVNRPSSGFERAVSNALLVFGGPGARTAAVTSGQ